MAEAVETQKFDPILDLAINSGVLDSQQAEELLEETARAGKPIRNLIVDMGYASEDDLLGILAGYMGCEVVDLPALEIPPEVRSAVPAAVARMHNVVPVSVAPGAITLACYSLVDPQAMDELMFVLARDVTFVLAREADVRNRVNEYYGDDSETVAEMLSNLETVIEKDASLGVDVGADEKDIEEQAGAAPVVRFVNLVLYQAIKDRASDIHFEPFEKEFRIRYRVDGALYEMQPPPKRLALPIISRIKVIANLNIAERRVPQDGRIPLSVAGRQVDLRVSCLPTQFGESVVLRVLDRSVVALDLENLGLPEDVLDMLLMDIEKPNGIIIVTGPTGSGKTTTLYSCLKQINTIDQKLLTAEEPVEYDMDGIIQVPINPLVGNTFPKALRAFLRQDPDIMMIGEIRDFETAEIAIQASLTGHLVFSTLHTNDAAGAVTRLVDMDVPPYLISSTLEAVLGQRLVRTICVHCKAPYEPDDEALERVKMKREQIGGRPFYYGRGCSYRNNTGYKGRKGLFEYLRITEPIRKLINERKPTLIVREKARELGMRTMREDGVRNVLDGYTTVDEVLEVHLMEQVIIVGSGPAGLTAAIYAARANLKPVVVEGMLPGGQLTQTSDVENFPGFEQPIGGMDLMQAMRRQAERLGVRFVMDEVSACQLQPGAHKLQLSMNGELQTRSVIIATGASARYLGLPSEKQLIGRGVSGCATCDGAFFRDEDVGVVGGGDTALEDALYLSRMARHVTLIHRRDVFRASKIMADRALANPKISVVWNAVVEDVLDVAKGEVTGARLRDVKSGALRDLPLRGLFIAIGHTPNTAVFKGQLDLDEEGYVRATKTRTSVPGVFCAGDAQDRHYKQAVTAAGTGCIAALEAERYLGALSA